MTPLPAPVPARRRRAPHTLSRQLLAALLLASSVATASGAEQVDRAPFRVGALEAAAGTRASALLPIPATGSDAGTSIPVTIVHGARPGPRLALIAGIHGYEYPGIMALQRLRATLDPAQLAGTVIMVHIANLPSFLGRTVYTNPVDGENLNRMFPGDPDGTLSERIAHLITLEVIEQADYLIDLHAGDGNEALRPYIYMPRTGDPAIDGPSRGLAEAFLLDTIVIDHVEIAARDATGFTDMTAWSRGVPAITTETGQLGSNDEHYVDMASAGLWNVLRHLAMVPGAVVPNDGIVWLEDYEVIPSPASGVFRAAVKDGWSVAEGGRLGVLTDFFGDEIAVIRAPFAGVVNYVIGTPPISEGEPVAMVSRVADAPPAVGPSSP